MPRSFIQLYENLLTYDGNDVYVVFADNTTDVYFHAKQLCLLLGYRDYRDAIRIHVENQDIYYLHDIVKDYKLLYKNAQGHTKFLNEGGMLTLVFRSHHKKAQEITRWVSHEVLPAVRKYGEYKVTNEYTHQIDNLKKIIDAKIQENKILRHNAKKQKFKKNSIVYILRTIEDTTSLELDTDKIMILRFGKTKDMRGRKPAHDTAHKNRPQVIKEIPVKNTDIIEKSVFEKMEDYRIRNNSSFFECTYNQLINTIADCIYFFENKNIDKTPDIHKNIGREKIYDGFDRDEPFIVKIEFDDDDEDNNCDDTQIGGSLLNMEINYLTHKLKFLELKCISAYFF